MDRQINAIGEWVDIAKAFLSTCGLRIVPLRGAETAGVTPA